MPISVSLNQLTTQVVKACLGGGVVRGVANEMGEVVARCSPSQEYLEQVLDDLVQALGEEHGVVTPTVSFDEDDVLIDKAHGLHHSASIVDFAAAHCGLGAVRIAQVDKGELLKAFIKTAPYESAVNEGEEGVTVRFLKAIEFSASLPQRASVDENVWAALGQYADKTMVPNDAASLADAGAGTTDND